MTSIEFSESFPLPIAIGPLYWGAEFRLQSESMFFEARIPNRAQKDSPQCISRTT
jgi:hypothetical protein